MTSTLDSDCQATLMMCTSSRNSSGEDLASFRNKTAKLGNILVIDVIRFVNAEAAYFSAALATPDTEDNIDPGEAQGADDGPGKLSCPF